MSPQASAYHVTNRRHKDTVFRDLFGSPERKANALSLYNALNGTSYSDPGELELTTLDDALYLGVKNDASFLIRDEMILWEHQSTYNPNMPLRGLVYFARLYSTWVERHNRSVYAHSRIELPTPHYTVFYIGQEDADDTETLRLSNSFSPTDKASQADLEVIAHLVNINAGRNPKLLAACKALSDYSALIDRIRRYDRDMDLDAAVDRAVRECIAEGILADYLTSKRAEVCDMLLTEYDEARERRLLREEAIREGLEEGRATGLAEGLTEGRSQFLSKAAAMVHMGTISLEDAAEGLGFSIEELREALDAIRS